MLPKEAFELPLEKQLRLQVIKTEINECRDIDALRENLLTCAEALMKYQHLTKYLVEQQMAGLLNEFLSTMGVEMPEQNDATN